MTNDYIYAVYELQSLFSRLLTNTMPASSNISKMFRAKETYYVRKIIEQLAHLKIVNYDSTLKHEIMQNCVNHAIELTAVYAQYLEVGESDDRNDWGILNDPEPIANQEPTIPYIQSIIDNSIEANEADGKDIGGFTPLDIRNIRTSEFSPISTQSINEVNEEEEDYKHDSAQINLPNAATVEHDIKGVIFVRSVIHEDVIYILPHHLFKLNVVSDGTPYLIIGDVCVSTSSELDLNEAKKYILRLEKTLAISALDPRTVDLQSEGEILILTLQGYDWHMWSERKGNSTYPMTLRSGFEIYNYNENNLKYIAHTWESDTTPFNTFDLHNLDLRDPAHVLVPTYTPEGSSYKLTNYNLVRCLPNSACNRDIESAENSDHLQSILDEYSISFNISDAIKIAEMSNPLKTPQEALMVGGVQRGSRLLTFDMSAIDDGPDSTFVEFRRLMQFPTFDQLDQKRDNYIDMDIGHWGLTKYFFSSRNSIQSRIFEGCRLSATTFESLMLSIYNISPVGEFEDFIYDFINEESKVDNDLGYKSWWFYKTSWADFQHLRDKDTIALYVAHLLHSLGSFEFYYREYGEVYLYELKSETFEETETYSLKLRLIRQVEDAK